MSGESSEPDSLALGPKDARIRALPISRSLSDSASCKAHSDAFFQGTNAGALASSRDGVYGVPSFAGGANRDCPTDMVGV